MLIPCGEPALGPNLIAYTLLLWISLSLAKELVTWAANHLIDRGLSLKKGQVVITGATALVRDIAPGDEVWADFEELGSVHTTIL